jgi:hypothetical protein
MTLAELKQILAAPEADNLVAAASALALAFEKFDAAIQSLPKVAEHYQWFCLDWQSAAEPIDIAKSIATRGI